MNFSIISAAFLLAGLVNPTSAKEPLPLPTNQVSVELAAPPMEGTVSIGVFDTSGKCIRVLYKNVDQERIPSALNGFLVNWDGKTDAGNIASKGEYEIRGVTVGDVSIEGEAYHFNDWYSDKKSATPTNIKSVRILENKDSLVLNESGGLHRYDSKGLSIWSLPVTSSSEPAIFGNQIFLSSANQVQSIDLEKGTVGTIVPFVFAITALNADSTGLLGIIGKNLAHIDPTALEPKIISEVPPGITMLAARGNSILLSDGTSVFKQNGSHFDKIDLPITEKITHLAIGKDDAFWAMTSDATLTEFDLNGQALRSLDAEGEDAFLTFDVNATDNQIALVSKKLDRQRFRILELTKSPSSDVSLWKTTLQKDIQPCEEFGIDSTTSKLASKGDLPAEKSLSISLIENPLTPDKKGSIAFTPASLDDGLWLTTQGGLPVIQIASDLTSKRMALVRDKKPDALRFYANIGGAVAEFSIGRLSNMMQFTSEKIQWPPGPRQAADEKDVPSNEPAPTPE